MPSIFEGIPVVGDAVGWAIDTGEDVVLGTANMVGTLGNAAADILIGEERKEKVCTELPTWFVDKCSDKDKLVQCVREVVRDARDTPLAELFGEALGRLPHLLSPVPIVEAATRMIRRSKPEEVESAVQGTWGLISSVAEKIDLPGTLLGLSRRALAATLARVGQVGVIETGIFSNEINRATLSLVWNDFDGLVGFLVALTEGLKRYAPASSLDGKAAPGDSRGGQHNELDLARPMNQHAMTCQIQRLTQSLVVILRRVATRATLDEIKMTEETTLRSDDFGSGTVVEVRPSGWRRVMDQSQQGPWTRLAAGAGVEERCEEARPPDGRLKFANEKWFFVNGIATELFWLHLACQRLAERYSREVTGVYNRSEGILWDLIECAGERDAKGLCSAESQKRMVARTQSSRLAQESLAAQLRDALRRAERGRYAHVAVVAHSQGCLVLRLALEEIILSACRNKGAGVRRTMLERLCVFTFGNPSVDWRLEWNRDELAIKRLARSKQESRDVDLGLLSSHVLWTEHFANEGDFVAKLGVLGPHGGQPESGYEPGRVFVNAHEDWAGHLFGTQYSLDSAHYKVGSNSGQGTGEDQPAAGKSLLLACDDKTSLKEALEVLGGKRDQAGKRVISPGNGSRGDAGAPQQNNVSS